MTLFGSTLYVVTDPQHTVEVYKNDTTLSFDEFAQDLVRTNGYSEAAVLASYTKLPVDKPGFPNPSGAAFGTFVRQMHMRQLYPGTELLALEKRFLAWYDQNLTESAIQESCSLYGLSARLEKDSEWLTVPAMQWCSNYATRGGEVSYFGDALGFINPNLASAFLDFDDLSWQVLYRYPALLSGKMRAARLQMMHAFTEYLRIPQTQRDGSAWLLNAIADEARQIGVADEDIAVLYFNIYWL
ncbi:hypothetical protein SLS64_011364 [Diaporthe eres]|uniref:Uncharacterized protein n=1 Tax=Diaporthe eres TaxID=83184 RepID=A0ABR1NMA3_DIAER